MAAALGGDVEGDGEGDVAIRSGESLEQGLAVARRLREEKTLVTLDYLGENVRSIEEARASRDIYLRSLEGLNGDVSGGDGVD